MVRFFLLGLFLSSLLICASEDHEDHEHHEENEDTQPPYEIPTPDKVFFYETFSSPLEELEWVISNHNEGKFKVGRGIQEGGIKSEQGLLLDEESRHYRISRKFPFEFDPSDQDFVIQYEVRFHKNAQCGGSYLKLLKSDPDFDPKKLTGQTEYIIMFGPDKCGLTDKVHFIFRHQHKISHEYEEKHLKTPPSIKNDRLTHLYTLVIRTDNTYEIFIDQISVSKGSLLEDFEPAVNPPKRIDDPDDVKPDDWVDQAKIKDPDASKPDDWDENAPKKIIDTDATQPSGWEVDEPSEIPDPQAEQPEDWDEEDDGEWEAPSIANPACSVGCGPWEQPLIPNPDYKGKWIHPMIDNPDFKGEWQPQQIDNPNYFEDPEPHKLHPMGGVALEVWTVHNGTEFDNLFIDNSLDKAVEFAKATWAIKYEVEKAADESGSESSFSGLMNSIISMMDYVTENPVIGVIIIICIIVCIGILIWVIVNACCSETPEDIIHTRSTEKESTQVEDKGDKGDDGDDGDNDDDDEGEPEEDKNKTNKEIEEGVDKVKEKQELEEAKKEQEEAQKEREQKKQKKKGGRRKKSRKAE